MRLSSSTLGHQISHFLCPHLSSGFRAPTVGMTHRKGSGATGSLSNDATMAAPSLTPPCPWLPSLAGGPPCTVSPLALPPRFCGDILRVFGGSSQSFAQSLQSKNCQPGLSGLFHELPGKCVPCSRLRKCLSALSLPSIWSRSHGLWQVFHDLQLGTVATSLFTGDRVFSLFHSLVGFLLGFKGEEWNFFLNAFIVIFNGKL